MTRRSGQDGGMTRVVDVVRAVDRAADPHAPVPSLRAHRAPADRAAPVAPHRGRVQLSALLVPSLVLHTIGAKSGEPRDAPLMYTPDGQGRAIVAGTNFAGGRHPAWTANLLAHPDAAITVRGRRMPVRAELVPDDERDAVWARIEAQWPGYRALRAGLGPDGAAVPPAAGARAPERPSGGMMGA